MSWPNLPGSARADVREVIEKAHAQATASMVRCRGCGQWRLRPEVSSADESPELLRPCQRCQANRRAREGDPKRVEARQERKSSPAAKLARRDRYRKALGLPVPDRGPAELVTLGATLSGMWRVFRRRAFPGAARTP